MALSHTVPPRTSNQYQLILKKNFRIKVESAQGALWGFSFLHPPARLAAQHRYSHVVFGFWYQLLDQQQDKRDPIGRGRLLFFLNRDKTQLGAFPYINDDNLVITFWIVGNMQASVDQTVTSNVPGFQSLLLKISPSVGGINPPQSNIKTRCAREIW